MIGITGSTGVLGKILLSRLESYGIELSVFKGDIRDYDSVKIWVLEFSPKAIIHLAAIVPVAYAQENPYEAFSVNVGGTKNLLDAIVEAKCSPWFFFSSTSHVYRSSPIPINESSELLPQNVYAETKIIAEQILQFYRRNIAMQICIGRIFSFYHETQKHPFLYPSVLKRLKNHNRSLNFELFGGHDVRDILNAEEVAEYIIKLLFKRAEGIVNIGSGKGIKIKDFVRNLGGESINILVKQDKPPTTFIADITRLKELTNGSRESSIYNCSDLQSKRFIKSRY